MLGPGLPHEQRSLHKGALLTSNQTPVCSHRGLMSVRPKVQNQCPGAGQQIPFSPASVHTTITQVQTGWGKNRAVTGPSQALCGRQACNTPHMQLYYRWRYRGP